MCVHARSLTDNLLLPHPQTNNHKPSSDGPLSRRPTAVVSPSSSDFTVANPRIYLQHRASTGGMLLSGGEGVGGAHVYVFVLRV